MGKKVKPITDYIDIKVIEPEGDFKCSIITNKGRILDCLYSGYYGFFWIIDEEEELYWKSDQDIELVTHWKSI